MGGMLLSMCPAVYRSLIACCQACAYDAPFESNFVEGYLGPILRKDHPKVSKHTSHDVLSRNIYNGAQFA
jgi:hypothetical protein